MGTLTIGSTWSKESTGAFVVPSISTKTIGTDSYIQIAIRMPLDLVADLSITNLQLTVGQDILEFTPLEYPRNVAESIGSLLPVPTNNDTFSILKWNGESFYFDPETGKVEKLLSANVPDGYLPLDGSTYVRTDKIASTEITYDRLYQFWESNLGNGNAFGYGSDGFYPMIYGSTVSFTMTNPSNTTNWADSVGAPTGFTFNTARESYTLDATASLIYTPIFDIGAPTYKEIFLFQVTNSAVGVVADATIGTLNAVTLNINVTQQGTAGLPEITIFRILQTNQFWDGGGAYFTIDSATTSYYVWLQIEGEGADPAVVGKTGIKVSLPKRGMSKFEVSKLIKEALEATGQFIVSFPITLFLHNNTNGVVTAATAGTTITDVNVVFPGSATREEYTNFVLPDLISAGDYITFDTTATSYYAWFTVDGAGADPALPGKTGIRVSLKSGDTQFLISLRTKQALDKLELTEITTVAGSSLSGGEYFDAFNSTTSFYVWMNKDGASVDPAPGGKTGIEVAFSDSDTAEQVAESIRKAVSSYFIKIPDARGYFFRSWSNGSPNEIDSLIRLDRGDGTIGDFVGTFQDSDVGSHSVQPSLGSVYHTGEGGTSGFGAGGDSAGAEASDNIWFADTKPKNMNILYILKY